MTMAFIVLIADFAKRLAFFALNDGEDLCLDQIAKPVHHLITLEVLYVMTEPLRVDGVQSLLS